MQTVNMHQAKTQLSKLVEAASKGEPFIIARAGKPLVKVVALDEAPAPAPCRRGFLAGVFEVPADFDNLYAEEIVEMFEGA